MLMAFSAPIRPMPYPETSYLPERFGSFRTSQTLDDEIQIAQRFYS